MLILHVATRADWERAEASGSYTGNTLAAEGFIHCAKPDQLMHVLTRYFPSVIEHRVILRPSGIEHVMVEIDTGLVEPEIRWEGAAEPFPHVYGPLNLSAVTRVKKIW